MNKTYSERRAAAYFEAARTLYVIASDILDDVKNDVELLGNTLPWAVSNAHDTYKQAEVTEEAGRVSLKGQPMHPKTNYSLNQASARYHAARAMLDMRRNKAMDRVNAKIHAIEVC